MASHDGPGTFESGAAAAFGLMGMAFGIRHMIRRGSPIWGPMMPDGTVEAWPHKGDAR